MRIYIFFLWMLGTIIGLTSCDSDSPTSKRIKSITFTGEENYTITLEYDKQGRLTEFIEEYSEPVTTTLTYGNGEVLIERFGNYYGKFILNAQGYVSTFKRENTSDFSYKYNADGYLIESSNGEHTNTYTYKNGNLASCETGNSIGLFTASDTEDVLKMPSFYQPHYLHILGNIEVRIGYLAGLYGKQATHLMQSSDYTIEKGKDWETQSIIDYSYQLDKDGYVTKQTEAGAFYYYRNGSKYQGSGFGGSMSFSYEDNF